MGDHYFTPAPQVPSDRRDVRFTVRGRAFSVITDAGIFSRAGLDHGSRVLLESLPELRGDVLDLGCGWGALGLVIAATMPETRVVMTDVNERAIALCRINCESLGLTAVIEQREGLGEPGPCYDAIVCNPPIRAGKAVTYALYADCRERLRDGGALYIVIRKQQGAESARSYLETMYSVDRIARDTGYWILRCTRKTT